MISGWELNKVGDVCEVIAGQSPEGRYYNNQNQGTPFYQGKKEFTEKYLGQPTTWTTSITRIAEPGDILMSVRAPVGPVNITNEKICIGRGLAAIRPGEKIAHEFLFNFLLLNEKTITGNTGAVFNSISKSQIENIQLPVPPLPEQQRIVALLDQAFAGIAAAKANAEKNVQNTQALFEKCLEKIFLERDREWKLENLGNITHLITDGKHGDCTNEANSGYYFLSAKDVKNGTLNFEEARQITKSDFEETHRRTNLKPGDVLLTNAGTIGRIAIAPSDERTLRTTFQKSVAVIKPNLSVVKSSFLVYQLQDSVKKLVNVSAGTAQKNLLLRDLRNFTIALPPLQTQETVIEKLNTLSEQTKMLVDIYRQKIVDLEELKKSLLQKAFAGELTEG